VHNQWRTLGGERGKRTRLKGGSRNGMVGEKKKEGRKRCVRSVGGLMVYCSKMLPKWRGGRDRRKAPNAGYPGADPPSQMPGGNGMENPKHNGLGQESPKPGSRPPVSRPTQTFSARIGPKPSLGVHLDPDGGVTLNSGDRVLDNIWQSPHRLLFPQEVPKWQSGGGNNTWFSSNPFSILSDWILGDRSRPSNSNSGDNIPTHGQSWVEIGGRVEMELLCRMGVELVGRMGLAQQIQVMHKNIQAVLF
jgi:hypothetical protein